MPALRASRSGRPCPRRYATRAPDWAQAAALIEIDALAAALDGYHLFHATRGELLEDLGKPVEAAAARRRALELTHNPAEHNLLKARLAEVK